MKSRPTGIIISAVAITVPVIIAMIMLGFYLRNKIIISVLKQETARWETEIGKFSELVKLQESFEKDRAVYSSCLAEVKSSIGRYLAMVACPGHSGREYAGFGGVDRTGGETAFYKEKSSPKGRPQENNRC